MIFLPCVSVDSIMAIAHMKPTSSRATAVIATVLRFPRAVNARYRTAV